MRQWDFLERVSNQVKKYSTALGQIWYMSVFMFRLIVVLSIGAPVYHDEQSSFKCSDNENGCEVACFNKFSKISHIRYWSFQLLGLATPVMFFHFYAGRVTSEIEKIQAFEKDKNANTQENHEDDPTVSSKKMLRRKKHVGKIKEKKIYDDGKFKSLYLTKRIRIAYFICVICRLAMEGLFIYLGYHLFSVLDPIKDQTPSALSFLVYEVPSVYLCKGIPKDEVYTACHQQTRHPDGYVPCWVSRPQEKTIFITYMNVLSGLGFLLCTFEMLYLLYRGARYLRTKANRRKSPKSGCLLEQNDSKEKGGGMIVQMEEEKKSKMEHAPDYVSL